MKITLLITAFNGLSQAVFTYLKDRKYTLSIVYASTDEQIKKELDSFKPEFILAPFLKSFISKEIYEKYPTYIFHPGPRGDRGSSSLEYALLSQYEIWGVSLLRANGLYDAGDIVAQENFLMRKTYKASLYRQEVTQASLQVLENFLHNPKKIKQIMNPIHKYFTRQDRTINWKKDDTDTIIKKIYLSDSFPGVFDVIEGVECYLFGVHKEDKLKGNVKEIIAKRDGAICLGTKDGAIWISHLKEPHKFKLPATYVLKEKTLGVKEKRIALLFDKSYNTFYEISYEKRDDVAYLCFNFHNGAMNAQQCIRLKYAFEYLKEECKTIVLIGGSDFFSNGIHLNILEDSKKQGEDAWSNINAMNDLIKSILEADEVITIASLARNAGAGGVFLALACDYVVAKKDTILNPHYKTLGLSGSEYHTYTLQKRVGNKLGDSLLKDALPISAQYAKKINMIDEVFDNNNYYEILHNYVCDVFDEDFLYKKQDNLVLEQEKMQLCKCQELEIMYPEFWEKESSFHTLRYNFVYKICQKQTPKRLQGEHHA